VDYAPAVLNGVGGWSPTISLSDNRIDDMSQPRFPSFDDHTEAQNARLAEDTWNSHDSALVALSLTINGRSYSVRAPDDMPLLWVLRDLLNLKGTKFGCGIAQCGACTVHVDGRPVRSCMLPAANVGSREVTTIEAISQKESGRKIQQAWLELEVVQCGYCQSGQIMSAAALIERNPSPDDAEIDAAMAGNICRCATYARIRAAIKSASRT
jgi:isoquinoline 1-oxidoreductase alpha subunit